MGTAIPGSAEVLQKLRDLGKRNFYVTNNSTKTRNEFLEFGKGLNYVINKVSKERNNTFFRSEDQVWSIWELNFSIKNDFDVVVWQCFEDCSLLISEWYIDHTLVLK